MRQRGKYNVTTKDAENTVFVINGTRCVGLKYLYKHYCIPNRAIYPRNKTDHSKQFPKPISGINPNRWRVEEVEQWMDTERPAIKRGRPPLNGAKR